jgi:hypothetical protein
MREERNGRRWRNKRGHLKPVAVATMVIVIIYEFFESAGCCSSVAGSIGSQ